MFAGRSKEKIWPPFHNQNRGFAPDTRLTCMSRLSRHGFRSIDSQRFAEFARPSLWHPIGQPATTKSAIEFYVFWPLQNCSRKLVFTNRLGDTFRHKNVLGQGPDHEEIVFVPLGWRNYGCWVDGSRVSLHPASLAMIDEFDAGFGWGHTCPACDN